MMDVLRRQQEQSSTDRFLDLIADPFQAEVSQELTHIQVHTDKDIGPAKFHLRRYRVQLCSSWPAFPRILFLATSKFPGICAESETCRRETQTYTSWQEAI